MFGPSPAALAAVRSVLRREGLEVTGVSANHLEIRLRTTVQSAERAFRVGLRRFQLAGGRVAFANVDSAELPVSIARYVQGVVGLNDVSRPQPLVDVPRISKRSAAGPLRFARTTSGTTGPQPCRAASSAAATYGSFTANQLAGRYAMAHLYAMGDLGQGVRVALVEFEPNSSGDVNAYASCYGITPHVEYHKVDGGAGSGKGSGEAALDIEDVMGLAPRATIDVYQAPNGTDQNVYDNYSALITADADKVISTSWGLCEADSDLSLLQSEQTLFEEANAQGQTVLAASGDSGSTDCLGDGTGHNSLLAVDDPASQPFVLGVGGTTLTRSETVWNESSWQAGAGGGGVSSVWCMPSYQDVRSIPGMVNSASETNSADCQSVSGDALRRQVPDLSADADPFTGYTIYYTGHASGLSGWQPIGGTSGAAPLVAAAAALVDASPFCSDYASGEPGLLPQGLYSAVGARSSYVYSEPANVHKALRDVASGDNDYLPSAYHGGRYRAGTGYDMASGLGTPLVGGRDASGRPSNYEPGLAALMCFHYATRLRTASVSSLSPSAGPTSAGEKITVMGSGFLPIPGAERLIVGSKTVTPNCTSTTRCTAVLPSEAAGVVNVRIVVEDDLAESPVASGDTYTFVPPPTISIWQPSRPFHRSASVKLRYGARDAYSPVVSYDVRYRKAAFDSGFGPYVYPAAWQKTTKTSEHLSAAAGFEYCLSVRAVTAAGVESSWSPDKCTERPLDDRALSRLTAGWHRRTGASYYLGTYTLGSRSGAELALKGVDLDRIALVVTRCAGCGSIAVYVNGVHLAAASTSAAETQHRVLLDLPRFAFRTGATVTLVDATGKGPVYLEGLGVSRY
jgi:hypothetical protein